MTEAEVCADRAEVTASLRQRHRPDLRSGIIGTGFMGLVHSNAIRAAGGRLVSVAGSNKQRAASGAGAFRAERTAETVDELIHAADIDVVHVCTPNDTHVQFARAALAAGKHVICEKPLATTADGARELQEAASASDRVAAVPFFYRFYPMVREARVRIQRGDAGDLKVLHGVYLQDWLADPTDTNWRVPAASSGTSRAFGDIGVHWVDLLEFTSGHRITDLCATTLIAYPERGQPSTRSAVDTEDVAAVLFRTDRGAVGTLTVSQVSQGRKNKFTLALDGANQSIAFDHEMPEQLWIGRRDDVSVISRGSGATSDEAQRFDCVPPGHPQGYQDCANAFVADVYAAVQGDMPDGLPTFADGLRAAQVTAAVLDSAVSGRWMKV